MHRKFFIKVTLLLLPFLLYFSMPLYTMLLSGELVSNKELLKIHHEEKNSLIGPVFSNPDKFLKLNTLSLINPPVLALGTSRVMQFRSFFFDSASYFYNAGGGVEKIKQFKYFIENIPSGKMPEILIISLDQYFFNENFDDLRETSFKPQYADKYSFMNYIISSSDEIWKDYINSKLSINSTFNKPGRYGLNAVIKNQGFRTDGSYYYGNVNSSTEERFKDIYIRIDEGNRRFQYTDGINNKAIEELKDFYSYCHSKNIHVIAFLPPFPHSVVEKIRSKGDSLKYIFDIYGAVQNIGTNYGYKVFNFTDLEDIGASDNEAVDGFHGSEKAYLRILIKLAEADEHLRKYCNLEKLKTMLKNSFSDIEVIHQEN